MRAVTLLVPILAMASCGVETPLPAGAVVSCERQADCPSGYQCKLTINRCLPVSVSSTPPELEAGGTVLPTPARAGAILEARFSTNVPLAVPPVVRLGLDDESAGGFVAVPGAGDDTHFVYQYLVTGDEPEEPTAVVVTLTDVNGNVAPNVNLDTVELDFSPPVLADVAVAPGLLKLDATTTVTFSATRRSPTIAVRGSSCMAGSTTTASCRSSSMTRGAGTTTPRPGKKSPRAPAPTSPTPP